MTPITLAVTEFLNTHKSDLRHSLLAAKPLLLMNITLFIRSWL